MSADAEALVGEAEANPAGEETASLLLRTGQQFDSDDHVSLLVRSGLPKATLQPKQNKPVLMRQDCTTTRLSVGTRPQLSSAGVSGGSEESTGEKKIKAKFISC